MRGEKESVKSANNAVKNKVGQISVRSSNRGGRFERAVPLDTLAASMLTFLSFFFVFISYPERAKDVNLVCTLSILRITSLIVPFIEFALFVAY